MATEIVKARSVSDFEKFAKLGQSNLRLEKTIAVFLAQLVDTRSLNRVKALCEQQLSEIREMYSPTSMPNRVTKYRKAIQACFNEYPIPEGLSYPQKTQKGVIDLHIAMQIMYASVEESAEATGNILKKTNADQDNPQAFPLWAAIEAAEKAIESQDWQIASAGLIFACQSRPIDLIKLGEVKAVGQYQIRFTTQAKKKGKAQTRNIWTLIRADKFVDAFHRLRTDADILELENVSNSKADSQKNSTINRKVRAVFGEIIPPPFTEKTLSAHNLRAAGAKAAYHLYGKPGQSAQRFVELQLIHDSKAASANYDDYYCVDEQGNEITAKGLRKDADMKLAQKPKSTEYLRPMLNKQTLEEIREHWEGSSDNERLIRVIAKAREANSLEEKTVRLEAQLARECEKRQKLELELSRLKAAGTEKAEVEHEPIREDEIISIDKLKIEPKPRPNGNGQTIDWKSVPNAELEGDRRNDAYKEKLRRSVEAIQEYNAGRELSEQYSITTSILRELAGVSPKMIKPWMDEQQEALESYRNAQGHTYRQNADKPGPRSVMKWSEAAYGEYQWLK